MILTEEAQEKAYKSFDKELTKLCEKHLENLHPMGISTNLVRSGVAIACIHKGGEREAREVILAFVKTGIEDYNAAMKRRAENEQ
jgi:hypothetical protein